MKKLNKIVLVQWYLLSAVEVPVRGNLAIVGPNASGKSSILDAVQTVLTGANKNRVMLNAGAGERSKRSIREYCLGVVDDPNLSASIRPREQSTTYLALGFVDEVTGEETCAGLAISATLSDPEERVEGRFIVPGLSVGLGDFIRHTPKGRETIPWSEVKQSFSRRFPDTVSYPTQSGRFTKELFAQLSEDKGYPNDDETILKNLKNAIVFSPITDTTEFVRKFILEEDESLRLGDLRRALKNYRDMSSKADEVATRIENLGVITATCDAAVKAQKAQATFTWVAHAAEVERILELVGPDQDALEAAEASWQELAEEERALEEKLESDIAAHAEKKALLANSDVEHRKKSLELELQTAERETEGALRALSALRTTLNGLPERKDSVERAPAALARAIREAVALAEKGQGIMEPIWPADPVQGDGVLAALLCAIEDQLPALEKTSSVYGTRLNDLEREVSELGRRTSKLKQGKAISDETESLGELLADFKIDSTPLCDLVDVADQRWRGAIESCLGAHREALIVPPDQATDAIRVYRREGRKYNRGQRVVDTTKSARWLNKAQPGSLAELVTTDNEHARAYVNRHLGNVIRVETEQELILHERAATADLMLYTGGATAAMRPVDSILGRQSRKQLLGSIQEEAREKGLEREGLQKEVELLFDLRRTLGKVQNALRDAPLSLQELVRGRDEGQGMVARLRQEIEDLTKHEDKGLKGTIAALEKEVEEARKRREALKTKGKEQQNAIAALKSALEQKERMLDHFGRERDKCALGRHFVAAEAGEVMERLREKFDWNYDDLIRHAEQEAKLAFERIGRTEEKARGQFREHCNRYLQSSEETASGRDGSFEELSHAVRLMKKTLEDTSLAEYRDKASRALYEAEIAFRAKFVVNLNARLEKVKALITDLNRHLKKRPFHEEIYQFKWKNNPQYEKVLAYIASLDAASQANVGGLFDIANDPTSPHREAIEEIAEALKDEGHSKHLEDYRNYLVFDFTMFDKDGVQKTSLKQRIQKGSGGENQAPFYVAIGASLASAYRIGTTATGKGRGGVALALFDEAFNKLDLGNCSNCLTFLKDIHLQVLLAAPDEKYGIMSENMNTVVRIFRDGGSVDLEVEYPTEEGQRLLRSDNPYLVEPLLDLLDTYKQPEQVVTAPAEGTVP
ncbi:MAG TPA: SbcC/MukB-like Walker B domain-containing protein [Geomonas sp.]|nr:SbcC/MukB-like Walker B domain-containing protein [Geomonas sp.]